MNKEALDMSHDDAPSQIPDEALRLVESLQEQGDQLRELIENNRVLVLCGAGGVGKTTTSAALAMAAAQMGRRVLVLTIDPARRLAEALGIPAHSPKPTPVSFEALESQGLEMGGSLDAWMLDPAVVMESLIRRLAAPERAEAVISGRIFQHLNDLASGMHEYAAAEALYELSTSGNYDLVVLDTPPSRNALDFLDAPGLLMRFLDDSVVSIFIPSGGKGLLERAGRLVGGVFSQLFGDTFVADFQLFVSAFSGVFALLRSHSEELYELLSSPGSSFLLVTSPEEEALDEALFFRDQISKRKLPFSGFILNRSHARIEGLVHPESLEEKSEEGSAIRSALGKMKPMAERELAKAKADLELLSRLREMAGSQGFGVAAPHLDEVESLPVLLRLAQGLMS